MTTKTDGNDGWHLLKITKVSFDIQEGFIIVECEKDDMAQLVLHCT